MRLLYAGNHPTLRESDLRVLMDSGFEVIPTLFGQQFRGHFRIDPRASDDPFRPINREWKTKTTLDPVTIERIQKINFYRITHYPFTYCNSEKASGDSTYMYAGEIPEADQKLINDNFDVIVVQSFPTIVPRLLSWFKGLVIFRVFGNEREGFSAWNWYQEDHYVDNSLNWFLFGNRYLAACVFRGIIETERPELLGRQPMVLHSVIQEVIERDVAPHRWSGEGAEQGAYVATNISYVDHSPSWQAYYEDFKRAFDGVPFKVFGKNDTTAEYCLRDPRIQPFIADPNIYLSKYAKARVFCNVGRLKQHSQYTPFECVAMGVPTLFLDESAIGYELRSIFPNDMDRLRAAGMVASLQQMREVAERCMHDIEFARSIAANQKSLFHVCFSNQAALVQGRQLFKKCEGLLQNTSESVLDEVNKPSANRNNRLLWAFAHKANRNEEVPVWLDAGFEVVPMKMPRAQASYQGQDYDDESQTDYPKWREKSTMSFLAIEYLREELHKSLISRKRIPKHIIKHLNDHFGYIYVPALYSMAVNLLLSGYKGVLLVRYYGHYRPGATLAMINRPLRAIGLGLLPQYFFLPALKALIQHESRWAAPPNRTFYVPYLRRSEKVITTRWSADASQPIVTSVMSMLATELNHYYRNFIHFFGQFSYRIYGKNRLHDLEREGIQDKFVSEQVAKEVDLHRALASSRVYIDPGLVDHHCHYTVIETILMGIPSLFWAKGGAAHEMLTVFPADELKHLGMFDTWEEMAVEVEKLLGDVNRAKELSQRQRRLHAFITRDAVLEGTRQVKVAGDHYFANRNSLGTQLSILLAKSVIRANLLVYKVPSKIRRGIRNLRSAYRLTRKLAGLMLVYVGLRKDRWGLRMKVDRFLQSRGIADE